MIDPLATARSAADSRTFARGNLPVKTWIAFAWLAAAVSAVEIPFLFRGTPSGHDVEFHLYSWLEALSQWKQGIWFPRWAAMAHFGYGEPRFIFYPPASWTLGALLSAIFPWALAVDVYIWIALFAAGATMFLLAREWLDGRDAAFAAVLYAVNPYHLLVVYWRSALAELLAASLLPLIVLVVIRAGKKQDRQVVPLALLLGCSWLINAPAAVMIHYSVVLFAVVIAWRQRSLRILWLVGASVVLGAALAAFYLLPAIYEQRWVDIAQAISQGSRPGDNFLFVHTSDGEHDSFNRIVSWIAMAEMVVCAAAAWAVRKRQRESTLAWNLLAAWGLAIAVMMLPVSGPLWTYLPKLGFMQFPWRWMLCLGVPFTLFATLGTRRRLFRIAIYAAMLFLLFALWHRYDSLWWEDSGDLHELQDNFSSGAGYEGTDEYTPVGADASAIDKSARRVTVEGPARAAIHVLEWNAEDKHFTADLSAADNLALHLFNYPAWKATVNGNAVQLQTWAGSGQMLVPVQAGMSDVRIIFGRTWDRTVGGWVSIMTLALILLFVLNSTSKNRAPRRGRRPSL